LGGKENWGTHTLRFKKGGKDSQAEPEEWIFSTLGEPLDEKNADFARKRKLKKRWRGTNVLGRRHYRRGGGKKGRRRLKEKTQEGIRSVTEEIRCITCRGGIITSGDI